MMTIKQYSVATNGSVFHPTLEAAQSALTKEGWSEFHAGNWRNPAKLGFNRDIRKQPKGFIVYESSYESR